MNQGSSRRWPALRGLRCCCWSLVARNCRPVLRCRLETAVPVGTGTELDRLIAPEEERRPGESGFRLVSDGPEGFAIRARAARIAGRSIDVQTYIWNGDTTGLALAYVLLRGGRPRREGAPAGG